MDTMRSGLGEGLNRLLNKVNAKKCSQKIEQEINKLKAERATHMRRVKDIDNQIQILENQ